MKAITAGLSLLVISSIMVLAQYSVQADDPAPHRIDVKYKGKLEFLGSNYEMERNIGAAWTDWESEMDSNYRALIGKLSPARRKQLQESQDAWKVAFEKDQDFFFEDPSQLRASLGREGEILSKMEFMNRVRKRALDLAEYLSIFGGDTTTPAEAPMVSFKVIETK